MTKSPALRLALAAVSVVAAVALSACSTAVTGSAVRGGPAIGALDTGSGGAGSDSGGAGSDSGGASADDSLSLGDRSDRASSDPLPQGSDMSGVQALPSSGPEDDSPAGPSDTTGAPESSAAAVQEFGGTFTWDDGIEVSLHDIAPYKPGKYASATKAPEYVSFTVTITNGGSADFDATMVMVDVLSGEREGSRVYDSDLGRTPSTTLLAGRSVDYDVAFGVEDADDVLAEVTPDFDQGPAFFATKAAATAGAKPGPGAQAAGSHAAFGEYFTWTDGISMAVSTPSSFTPSKYAAVSGAEQYVVFTVRLTNASSTDFDMAMTYATLQSGTSEADQVFDSEQGVSGAPMVTILAGHSVRYEVAFGVNDPDDLVMEISPGFNYDSAIFSS